MITQHLIGPEAAWVMGSATRWLIDTMVATGALIAAVLVLRAPVARLFGPGIAYALWALPLVRTMLPPLVLPASLRPVMHGAAAHFDGKLVASAVTRHAATPTPSTLVSWPLILLALWFLGAALFLAARTRAYRALRRDLLAGARPMGGVGAVRIIESPAVESPVAFGVRDRMIALPPGFLFHTDPAIRELAIAHELEHHAARDLVVNIAFQPLLALHWFNPLAWMAWRAMRQDQEAACDARVLAGRGRAERHRYGQLIASLAAARSPAGQHLSLAASMAGPLRGRKAIVHRLHRIAAAEPSKALRLAGVSTLALATLALPLTASVSYASAHDDGGSTRAAPAHRRVAQGTGPTSVSGSDRPLRDTDDARAVKAGANPPETATPDATVSDAMPAAPAAPPAPAAPMASTDCDASGDNLVDANGRENPGASAALRACIRQEVEGALREADASRREALQDAAEARREALRDAAEARRESDDARREALAEQGANRAAIRQARAEIVHEKGLTAAIRSTVLEALDNALAGMRDQS